MRKVLVLSLIYYATCFIKTCSNMKPKEALCILYAGVVIPCFGRPSFYELVEEEIDDIDSKYDILHATFRMNHSTTASTTSTERPFQDEWKLRGRYRVQCVDETRIVPSKVVSLMSGEYWRVDDKEIQKWALCVLKKMGLMSDEGVFKMDVAMSKIPEKYRAHAETLIDACLTNKALPPHQIAWNYIKCHNRVKGMKGNFSAISVF